MTLSRIMMIGEDECAAGGVDMPDCTNLNHFANQRDTLGLITIGMSYYLASEPTQNCKPSLDNTIAGIDCSGGTGSAQALWTRL